MRKFPALVLVWVLAASSAAPAAIVGFVEDFNIGTGSFGGNTPHLQVPAGGVGGAGDGYVEISSITTGGQLGIRSIGAEFNGNLTADGVTGFSFWLNDVGQDDPLEIHVGVGTAFANFWLYMPGFAPPSNGWQQYSVDFSNPADWVQIIGSGTFADALANSDRLLFRHDLAPFIQNPDSIAADFGLDRVAVLPEPATLLLLAGGAILARRRAWR